MRLRNKMFERKRYVVMRKDISVEWENGVPVVTRGEVPVHMLKVKGTPLISQDSMADRMAVEQFGPGHSTFGVKGQARTHYVGLINDRGNSSVGRGSVF